MARVETRTRLSSNARTRGIGRVDPKGKTMTDTATSEGTSTGSTGNEFGESGWVTFAIVIFLVAGVANVVWGIGALLDREYFDENGLIFGTLTTWGWIAILWGAAEILVSIGLFQGSNLTRWIGVTVACIGAVFWFLVLPILPLFALTVIILAILVIYGLSAHWPEA